MEQSINPHAYCRLRFDEAAEEAIENLANVLQWHRNSPFEGLFVAQKDARAGARLMSSSFFNNHRLIHFSLFLSLSRACAFLKLSEPLLRALRACLRFCLSVKEGFRILLDDEVLLLLL